MCSVWLLACMPLLHSLSEQANTSNIVTQWLRFSGAELASNVCYNTAPRSRALSPPFTMQLQPVLAPTPWCLCSQQTSARVEPAAKAIGNQCGVEAWAIELFAEEVVRPLNLPQAFLVGMPCCARIAHQLCTFMRCSFPLLS